MIAPPLPRPVLFDQFWADLTFVHWPVEPQRVAHLFPPGTRPDVFSDGLTYAALVPFVMRHTALGTSLRLPYFGSFAETNIRLYSIDDAGRHGVLFRSLETTRLAVVGFTRAAMGVPYTWAKMRVTRGDDEISYSSVRRWPTRGLRSTLTSADRRRGDTHAAGGMAHGALGRTHPQGRADMVGAQRTLRVAAARGSDPRLGR